MVGVVRTRGRLLSRAPYLLSWRGWGLSPACPLRYSCSAFSSPQPTAGVVPAVSQRGWPCGQSLCWGRGRRGKAPVTQSGAL